MLRIPPRSNHHHPASPRWHRWPLLGSDKQPDELGAAGSPECWGQQVTAPGWEGSAHHTYLPPKPQRPPSRLCRHSQLLPDVDAQKVFCIQEMTGDMRRHRCRSNRHVKIQGKALFSIGSRCMRLRLAYLFFNQRILLRFKGRENKHNASPDTGTLHITTTFWRSPLSLWAEAWLAAQVCSPAHLLGWFCFAWWGWL